MMDPDTTDKDAVDVLQYRHAPRAPISILT